MQSIAVSARPIETCFPRHVLSRLISGLRCPLCHNTWVTDGPSETSKVKVAKLLKEIRMRLRQAACPHGKGAEKHAKKANLCALDDLCAFSGAPKWK